ncbi:uroporphyrinogen-III C-methyltransferase [Kineobactrum salinum]|uniref:Uroporphyrinogen III n=1 Tax=Kineobactrum salinum TaxID=2708301 RepID=A0A6C0TZJ3_9GAMM|nr:uroporphyrinogen-III C-methyltransferase [Kineobactrum salinum]QIB65252.1 uroporphyrinogen III [Kineobactrum salinum]
MSEQQKPTTQHTASEPSATEETADTPAKGEQAPPPAARGGAIAWLALLLVVVLAAAAGWQWWLAQQRESALLQRLEALENRPQPELPAAPAAPDYSEIRAELKQLEQRLRASLEQGLADLRPRWREQDERLQQLEAQLAGQSTKLARITGGDRANWLLAEAEYLLRLANQRLIMTADVGSARALLQSADRILRQLDDVSLHPVRRALAGELAALRAVPEADIEGLYLRLAALVDQVPELAIFELPRRESEPVTDDAGSWQGRLRQGYQEALRKLSGYVTVRRRELPATALIDPQWEGLLRQNLVMLLQQAQAALLSGNAVLYRESLQRAHRWVSEFFLTDEAAARAMAGEIDQLAEQPVGVELPDISASLRALDAAVAQRTLREEDQ